MTPVESSGKVTFRVPSAPGGVLLVTLGTRNGTAGAVTMKSVVAPSRGYLFTIAGPAGGD